MDALERWDEREAAGNCPIGLFLFHPLASGQSLDTAPWETLESEESVATQRKTEKGAAVLGKLKRNMCETKTGAEIEESTKVKGKRKQC